MHRAGLVRLVRMGLVYLLVAAAAALGWLWHALPEEICLEPGQTLQLPRFAWVEPLRGRGSRNVASTRAVGSYQVTLALGGWLPVRTIRAVVTERPTVTVCGTPFGVKMFSEGALVVGFSDVNTAAGPENPAKAAGLRLGDRVIRIGSTATEDNDAVKQAGVYQRGDQAPVPGDRQAQRHHRQPGGARHPPCHRGGVGPGRCGHVEQLLRLHHPQPARKAHQQRVHCHDRG